MDLVLRHRSRGGAVRAAHLGGAVLLMLAGLFGLLRAIPAASACARYYQVKYGARSTAEPAQRLHELERVFARMPGYYDVAMLGSDICWDAYVESGDRGLDPDEWAARSLLWCERGLATGCALPGFFSRKASLLARDGMRQAAAYWAAYVDTVYWHPANQALLCEFYARAGMLEEAAERLALLEGRPEHRMASRLFHEAVREQMRRPPRIP